MSPFAISLQGVSAAIDGHAVLHDIHVDVPRGALTVVTGHNGSGKSTLLSVLAGTHPSSGGLAERDRRDSIAFVVQRSSVSARLPLTVRETVAMGRWGHKRASRAHSRAIVETSLRSLRVDDLADRSLHELSGGQRQRVLVAQGLAQQADILLLDEPTASVDAEARALIHDAISREVARGAAVVMATHDALDDLYDHRLVALSGGRRVTDYESARHQLGKKPLTPRTANPSSSGTKYTELELNPGTTG